MGEQEMALRDGIGVIPAKLRNKGYEKLDYGPGEGGRPAAEQPSGDGGDFQSFLAGVAAGADPQELAKQLKSGPPKRRGR